jgi:hypothetical protein
MLIFHRGVNPYATMWHNWMGWVDFLNACFGGYKDDPMDKVVELNEFVNEGKEEDSHRVNS